METLGHQKAIKFLLTTSMNITTFVSDRHATIAKWMRETCPKMCKELGKPVITHFFICGTLEKVNMTYKFRTHLVYCTLMYFKILYNLVVEIQKILIKLAKEKDYEVRGRWRKACVRHFYWAATSTLSGIGNVK